MLHAHEVIGMDEVPPSTFEFNPHAPVLVDLSAYEPHCEAWELIGADEDVPACMAVARELTREPLGADEAFPVLDEAYDAGVESTQAFVGWLHRVDVPACEAREFVAAWRSTHTDPWIRAHDEIAELECK